MKKREFLDYVEDILASMTEAESFVEGMDYETFAGDRETQLAVIRALEVIGEGAKRIPLAVRSQYPDIPWKKISGMRDKLIHE